MICCEIPVGFGFSYGLDPRVGHRGNVVSISPNGQIFCVGSYALRPGCELEAGSHRKSEADDGFYAAIGRFVGYGNTKGAALDAAVRLLQSAPADPVEPIADFSIETIGGVEYGRLVFDKFRFRCGCVAGLDLLLERGGEPNVADRLTARAAERERAACPACSERMALPFADRYHDAVAAALEAELVEVDYLSAPRKAVAALGAGA